MKCKQIFLVNLENIFDLIQISKQYYVTALSLETMKQKIDGENYCVIALW